MKWWSIAWQVTRDVGLTGFGAWVIWKQVYAAQPNPTLLLVALGCITPAARSAVTAILSGPGPTSESLGSGPRGTVVAIFAAGWGRWW